MKLQIKRAGNSLVLRLPTVLLKYHNLKEGDWLDLSDAHPIRQKEEQDRADELENVAGAGEGQNTGNPGKKSSPTLSVGEKK